MKWNLNPRLLLAGFCLKLAKSRYKETAGEDKVQSYAWNIYYQTDVEYSPLDKIIVFAYKGQEIIRVSNNRVTSNTNIWLTEEDIWLTEEEADKANAMIGLIDSFP